MDKAIVVGVGPVDGLGGQLCRRFAREGLHVFAAGRTRDNRRSARPDDRVRRAGRLRPSNATRRSSTT
jgi:NAD(P)-dependent dehydrogenase (short-subunit alcohol dehydrogenase family)